LALGGIGFLLTGRAGGAVAQWNAGEGIAEEKQAAQVLFWVAPICKLRLKLATRLRVRPARRRIGVLKETTEVQPVT
jgi:hypothetical protein